MRLRPWRKLQSVLTAGLRNETRERMKTSAMVFAPHPDDETLGCGGTIILKRQAGTPVTCVFMTDGSTSHRRLMHEEELRGVRKEEAFAATSVLGLAPEDVHFLDFPDSKLSMFHDAAVTEVTGLLNRFRPEEVFVPYRADGLADHEATFKVVMDAVSKAGLTLQVYEYPIWLWNQWPWVPLSIQFNRDAVRMLLRIVRAGFGLRLMWEFRIGVFVGDQLDKKRQALAQHRTQMTVFMPGIAWPTLKDVSDGEFLKCFFQESELFRCRNVHSKIGSVSKNQLSLEGRQKR